MGKGSPIGMVTDMMTGGSATKGALKDQAGATNSANATLKQGYDDQASLLSPFRDAGLKALAGLQDPNFGKNLELDPGYQFRMQEGQKALNNAASARGMGNSGATMKALSQYNQNFATNEYNNAYNRQASRLGTLLGVGENANNMQVQARNNWAQGVSGNQIGMGNAQAAAKIGQADRTSNMLGQAAGMAAMAFSDERLKTNVVKLEVSQFKDVPTYEFEYIDKTLGEGRFVGVMAQDLLKLNPQHPAVIKTPIGYAVNYNLVERIA